MKAERRAAVTGVSAVSWELRPKPGNVSRVIRLEKSTASTLYHKKSSPALCCK